LRAVDQRCARFTFLIETTLAIAQTRPKFETGQVRTGWPRLSAERWQELIPSTRPDGTPPKAASEQAPEMTISRCHFGQRILGQCSVRPLMSRPGAVFPYSGEVIIPQWPSADTPESQLPAPDQ